MAANNPNLARLAQCCVPNCWRPRWRGWLHLTEFSCPAWRGALGFCCGLRGGGMTSINRLAYGNFLAVCNTSMISMRSPRTR